MNFEKMENKIFDFWDLGKPGTFEQNMNLEKTGLKKWSKKGGTLKEVMDLKN